MSPATKTIKWEPEQIPSRLEIPKGWQVFTCRFDTKNRPSAIPKKYGGFVGMKCIVIPIEEE